MTCNDFIYMTDSYLSTCNRVTVTGYDSTDTKVVVSNHAWSARKGILHLDGERMLRVSANQALEQLDPGKFAFELDRQAVFIASIRAASPNGHGPKDISAHLHRVSL